MLLVVIAVAALALAKPPRRGTAGRLALALLALALALSVLGIVTPGSRAVGVLLGNLLGGLLMLGLSWRLATQLAGWPISSPRLARWALLGAALWLAQAAFGALSGSGRMPPRRWRTWRWRCWPAAVRWASAGRRARRAAASKVRPCCR